MPSVDEHLREPDITIDQYVRRCQIALAQEIAPRRAVYLDTKFWIILRNTARGEDAPDAIELLTLLRNGVRDGLLFCPISEDIFLELMKQKDMTSRLATASLIDELSLGVTLVQQDIRIATEVAYFMHTSVGRKNLNPPEHLAWCKLSHVLGIIHPTETIFDPATERAVQKAFFDHMSMISLPEMISRIGDKEIPGIDLRGVAENLNVGNAAHADELRSYEQSYSAEVRGMVDLTGTAIHEAIMMLAADRGIGLREPAPEQRRVAENGFKNLLAVALERDKARDVLRTIHIFASLHASARWNKRQRLKGNDLFDFHHGVAALGYCDAFFTDGPFRTMVTQKHLALDRRYNCYVTADVREAIDWIRRTLRQE